LQVLDIVIHRFLELPSGLSKSLETLFEHLGGLYKFHDRPVTYLYNTLHYYEKKLKDRPLIKRKLVHAIIGKSNIFLFTKSSPKLVNKHIEFQLKGMAMYSALNDFNFSLLKRALPFIIPLVFCPYSRNRLPVSYVKLLWAKCLTVDTKYAWFADLIVCFSPQLQRLKGFDCVFLTATSETGGI
jgi:hypothetical protein